MIKKFTKKVQGFKPAGLVLLVGLGAVVAGALLFMANSPKDQLAQNSEPANVNVKVHSGSTQSNAVASTSKPAAMLSRTPSAMADESAQSPQQGQWTTWGGNLFNTHNAKTENKINPENVADLTVDWSYDSGGDVTSPPALIGNTVYFSDWGNLYEGLPGKMHAVDAKTGQEKWTKSIGDFRSPLFPGLPLAYNNSRTTPAVSGNTVIMTETMALELSFFVPPEYLPYLFDGPNVYALDKNTGDLLWQTKVDTNIAATITAAPVIFNGKVYVGVSSFEEGFAGFSSYPCCSFVGSLVILDLDTGEILSKTYTIPEEYSGLDKFSGASIWGSSFVVDSKRNVLYAATGDNYDSPIELQYCLQEAGDDQAAYQDCLDQYDPPNNYFDSVVAFDLDTGSIKWGKKTQSYDAYNIACGLAKFPVPGIEPDNCPDPRGRDYDFGQAPMLVTVDNFQGTGKSKDLLLVGQKSGFFYAMDPDNEGELVWTAVPGPGDITGGMLFGAATDGERAYFQLTNWKINLHDDPNDPDSPIHEENRSRYEYTIKDGSVIDGGSWGAIDLNTGDIVWQTPIPGWEQPVLSDDPDWGYLGPGYFKTAPGPLAVANGVVFAAAEDLEGTMLAMDAETGEILWTYYAGQPVSAGPAVVNGSVYWGTGSKDDYLPVPNMFYKFSLPK